MFKKLAILFVLGLSLVGCREDSQTKKDKRTVEIQQGQYAKAQPVPLFNWSLERDLLIKLYNVRNRKVTTHSVWRSDYGIVEGDCPSMGYGLPYDTSLTNPLQTATGYQSVTSVGQAEPNGIFASTNTSATWVMCIGSTGLLEPVYIESKVTVYPSAVKVNYKTNRVKRTGKTTVTIKR